MSWKNFPTFISHRGNLIGKCPHMENSPEYVIEALNAGYDVEIDFWVKDDKLYLGHDEPQYEIESEMLEHERLWIHAKNAAGLNHLSAKCAHLNWFWHEDDAYTITSKGYVWAYPGKPLVHNSVCVLPEREGIIAENLHKNIHLVAICSDTIAEYKAIFDKLNDMENFQKAIDAFKTIDPKK